MSNYAYDDDGLVERPNPTVEAIIEHLLKGEDASTSETLLYGLSDLSESYIEEIRPVWQNLEAGYKQLLMQILIDEMESHFDLNYDALGLLGIEDTESLVRRASVEILGESESLRVMRRLFQLLKLEKVSAVKAETARVLGHFILLDEVGDIKEGATREIRHFVESLYQDKSQSVDVRARALEAIANSSESVVEVYIKDSYRSDDDELKLASVVAMGRSADRQQWESIILNELMYGRGDIQIEAARATGELQIGEAIPHLMKLFEEDDIEAQTIIIWALGEIGNREATRYLERIAEIAEENEDDDMLELVEEALGNASLGSGGRASDVMD